MKYNALTEQQKKAICEEAESRKKRGEKATCQALGKWVKERFNLEAAPGKSSISRTLKRSDALLSKRVVIDKVTRQRKGTDHRLEKALYAWVNDQIKSQHNLTGMQLVKKAAHLQSSANEKLPVANRISLKFSDGWLNNFKRRWGLKCLNRDTRGDDGLDASFDSKIAAVQKKLKPFLLKDIFNAVEWGLLYNLAPDEPAPSATLGDGQGDGDNHEALAILVCCNADGSEKYKPMFVGNAEDLFASTDSKLERRSDYCSNHRAWITCHLFYDWLQHFDVYIGMTPGRNAALVVSNCSAHGTTQTLPGLRHVTVVYLPTDDDAESEVQPCNAGIIALMKTQYRAFQLERALDLVQEDPHMDVYNVGLLTAMEKLEHIWSTLPAAEIQNGWKKSGILPNSVALANHLQGSNSSREKLVDQVRKLLEALTEAEIRMPLETFLNPPKENCCVQDVSDDALVESILESRNKRHIAEQHDDVPLPSYREQLKAIAVVTRLARNHTMDESFLSQLVQLQCKIPPPNNESSHGAT